MAATEHRFYALLSPHTHRKVLFSAAAEDAGAARCVERLVVYRVWLLANGSYSKEDMEAVVLQCANATKFMSLGQARLIQ